MWVFVSRIQRVLNGGHWLVANCLEEVTGKIQPVYSKLAIVTNGELVPPSRGGVTKSKGSCELSWVRQGGKYNHNLIVLPCCYC